MLKTIGKYIKYYITVIVESFLVAGFMNYSFYYSLINFINLFRDEIHEDMYVWGFWILLMIVGPVTLLSHGSAILLFLLSLLCLILSLVNYYEFMFRGTVLVYQDYRNIGTAGTVLGNYTFPFDENVKTMVVCFALSVATILIAKLILRKTKVSIWPKILIVAVDACLLFNYLVSENNILPDPGWSWEQCYLWNGFVVGAATNVKYGNAKTIEPEGYAADQIEIFDPIPATTQEYPDIVLILNETYYDMKHLIDLETDVDYMENYNNLDAFKGYAAVPVAGGGTNDSEYELLTGNSLSLLNTYSPFNNLNFKDCVSIVKHLKELGYYTMANHPSYGSNYHREAAWKLIGFDEGWFEPSFIDLEQYGPRIYSTDSSVFKNMERFYEDMPEDQPRFTFCITIQNHGYWDSNPRELDTVFSQNAYASEDLDEFLTCIKLSDEAIPELIEYFRQSERPVVVCMVGDHAPSFISRYDTDKENEHLIKRQVPYFIWSNMADLTSLDLNPNIDLCALTPYTLYAGGLPLSPYYANIIEQSQSIQCFTNILKPEGEDHFSSALGYILTNGELHYIDEDTPDAKMLRNYFYSENNLISDKNRVQALVEIK